MFGLGPLELLIILAILLLLFGAKRIAGVARGLGDGIGNFRREVRRDTENRNSNDSGDH